MTDQKSEDGMSNEISDVFSSVDDVVRDALASKDPTIATYYGRHLRSNVAVQGTALAKLLWGLNENWAEFQAHGIDDDFYSFVESQEVASPATARKYVRLWDAVFANPTIPDEVKKRLLTMPTKTLLLLPALAEDGEANWEAIAGATDHQEVRNIVREARGEATSSASALLIRFDLRSGQLSAKRGDEMFVPFGLLNVQAMETNDTIRSAINRIIENSHIMEI